MATVLPCCIPVAPCREPTWHFPLWRFPAIRPINFGTTFFARRHYRDCATAAKRNASIQEGGVVRRAPPVSEAWALFVFVVTDKSCAAQWGVRDDRGSGEATGTRCP